MNVLAKVKEAAPHATQFVWDGCHKIYIIESKREATEAKKFSYAVLNIEDKLEAAWEESCELKFINFWRLGKGSIIAQGEDF